MQRWRHKFVFFNSWRCTLRRRLIFHTYITFNKFYCWTKFQCDDIILVHFTDQNSFQGLCYIKLVSFAKKKKKKKKLPQVWDFMFFATPCKFRLKKLITAVTMSSSVFLTSSFNQKTTFLIVTVINLKLNRNFDCMYHWMSAQTNLVLYAINFISF